MPTNRLGFKAIRRSSERKRNRARLPNWVHVTPVGRQTPARAAEGDDCQQRRAYTSRVTRILMTDRLQPRAPPISLSFGPVFHASRPGKSSRGVAHSNGVLTQL